MLLPLTATGCVPPPRGAHREFASLEPFNGDPHLRVQRIDDGPGGTNCRHDAQSCWNLLAALTLSLRDGFPSWLDRLTVISLAADSLDDLEISLSEPSE